QQIQQPTFPVRDLRRMGLHHAVIVEQTNAPQLKIGPDVKNVTAPTRVLGKGAGGGGGPMGPGTLSTGGAAYPGTEGYSEGGAGYPGAGYPGGTGPMGPGGPGGASGEGVKVYEGTAFKIQFVLQYIPPEERAAIVTDEPTVQEGAAPVEAADATTPPAAP
ncbi:MAG: hypothetical protein KDA66_19805, partial [Planctomycetaceae bacterium]|nr:hypothetical protein [Planctomycetaceae bacterium]